MPQTLFPCSLILALALSIGASGCMTPVDCDTDEQCVAHAPALRCEQRGEIIEKRCYRPAYYGETTPRRCGNTPIATFTSKQPSDNGSSFGSALAAWGGSRLLVGNRGAKIGEAQVGDGVIFETTDGWKSTVTTSLRDVYLASSAQLPNNARFGIGVALSASNALVTSLDPTPDPTFNKLTGFLFNSTGVGAWANQAVLDPAMSTQFNSNILDGVALEGDYAFFATNHLDKGSEINRIHGFSEPMGAHSILYEKVAPQQEFGATLIAAESRIFFGMSGSILSFPISSSATIKTEKSGVTLASLASWSNFVVFGLSGNTDSRPFHTADIAAAGWSENVPQPDLPQFNYGKTISIYADLLAVSNVGKPVISSAGEVTIYQNVNQKWSVLTILKPPVSADADATMGSFGAALAVSKDYVFVGAPKSKINGSDAQIDGAVFVFYCPFDTPPS